MFVPATHYLSLTKIRRERYLPLPGTVLVAAGQAVKAADVIAETGLTNSHLLIDTRETLGLSPRQAASLMQVKLYDAVHRGDILAGPVGFPPRQLRAAHDGTVVYLQDGQLILEVYSSPYRLLAGLDGQVTKVVPGRGAVIESTGALIQGVWGNDRLGCGELSIPSDRPDAELTGDFSEKDLQRSILLAGTVRNVEVLRSLKKTGVAGLILGSLPGSLVPLATQLDIPIIALDGFGQLPVNPVAYRILSEHAGREVIINSSHWDRYNNTRPEVVIPTQNENLPIPPVKQPSFMPGQEIRVNSSLNKGKVGKFIALEREQVWLENGIQIPAATIHLEDGNNTSVPLANLEALAVR
jgi:hypothetical protein